MSYLHRVSSRTALASAALLSLAMLAGCQSTPSSKETGSSNSDMANTNNGSSQLGNGAMPSLPQQLAQVGDRVHFALDRYDLAPDAEATLQKQAALLQSHPEVAVTIQGHADERGTREYNLALGERRADTKLPDRARRAGGADLRHFLRQGAPRMRRGR